VPRQHKMYINGEWVNAISGRFYDDYNPATGEVFAKVPCGERADMKQAIDAASAAWPAWANMPSTQRGLHLLKAAETLEKRLMDLSRSLSEETGSTFGKTMVDIMDSVAYLRNAAFQVHNPTGELLPSDMPDRLVMVKRRPVGVVGIIPPWNFPVVLSIRAIAPALACGNTVVLKPSSESAVSGGIMLAEVFEAAGFPKGVFNVVTNGPGLSGEMGDEIIANPKVQRISFTGSTEVGKCLAEKAGKYLKKIVLELGGSDPLIILKDAEASHAANAAAFGRFFHQGQICMSSKRIIVEKPIAQEFIQKFVAKVKSLKVGDPREQDTIIGPVINQCQLDTLRAQVEDAVAKGAKLLCGGKYEGLYCYPTVLTDVTTDMKVFREEVFGPVAPVIVAEDADDAVRLANDSVYGLSAGIITNDFQKGLDIADKIESGMVHINDTSIYAEPPFPFGGIKESGLGRHGGRAAIEEFFTKSDFRIFISPNT
jgi:acyl-CoA reductase-like NAD-dependent aldehyde dehydrogenase